MRKLIALLVLLTGTGPVLAEVVAITTDFENVRAAILSPEAPTGQLEARSGGLHYHQNGSSAILVVDSLSGLEGLAVLADTITNYREIFGYRQQQVIDGEPQWTTEVVDPAPYESCEDNWVENGVDGEGFPTYENQPICTTIDPEPYEQRVPVYEVIPRVPGLLETYQSIYPYNVPDEDGNTRSQFVTVLNPKDVEDVLEVP